MREVRSYVRSIGARLDEGRGIWFTGTVGTGKTTLAMLVSKAAMDADRTVAIYSLPRLLALLRESFNDGAQYSLNESDRAAVVGRPSPYRRRRRRAELAVGPRAAVHDRQHALRGRQGAAAHHEPRSRGARGADRAADGVADLRDLRRAAAHVGRRSAHPAADAGRRAGSRRGRVLGRRRGRAALRTPPPRLNLRYGRHRDRGRPMGRRGQGQDHRPVRGARGPRDPLPGRQQRRPHDRARRAPSGSST